MCFRIRSVHPLRARTRAVRNIRYKFTLFRRVPTGREGASEDGSLSGGARVHDTRVTEQPSVWYMRQTCVYVCACMFILNPLRTHARRMI